MTSLTTRGRVAVVVGFVVSAGLCAGAAVALVKASDHTTTGTLPQVHPTLIFPSSSPTPTPSPSASPTPAASPTAAPVATGSASASPTRSATTAARPPRRATHQPTTVPVAVGPAVDAQLVPVDGQPGLVRLLVHATSDAGPLTLTSVNWDDGSKVETNVPGTACKAPAGGDCEDYTRSHTFSSRPTPYKVTVVVSNGAGSTTVVLETTVTTA